MQFCSYFNDAVNSIQSMTASRTCRPVIYRSNEVTVCAYEMKTSIEFGIRNYQGASYLQNFTKYSTGARFLKNLRKNLGKLRIKSDLGKS